MEWGLVLAMAGAFVAIAFAGIGSAVGCTFTGEAADGVMSEDPDKFGGLLILTVVPGTQGVYGFISGFIVFMKLGLLAGTLKIPTLYQGLEILIACGPVGLVGMISAIYQGKVCATGAEMLAKQPTELFKPLLMATIVEFYAILGLISTIFMLNAVKI